MKTDVDLMVTADDFATYEKRFADCGMGIRPLARETVEDIEKGGVSHVTISGILTCGEAEYVYHITKYATLCRLTVDAFSHGTVRGNALMNDLRHLFPHPKGPHDLAPGSANRRALANLIVCLVILALVGALFYFAIVGLKSVFWK
jgi:hypothetical protein